MATTAGPAPAAAAPINHFGRMFGALVNPKPTFEEIARRPSWIAPVVVLSLIWLSLNLVLVQRVDWMAVTKQQIEKNRFASSRIEQLPADQQQQVYEAGARRARIFRYARGVAGWPVVASIYSVIYMGAFRLFMGARVNYKPSFALVSHAFLPWALRELIAIPVVLFKDPAGIDPENFLASNVAAFLSPETPLWKLVLAGSLDVFGFWSLVLVALGFSAADPKKVSLTKGLAVSLAVFGLVTLFFTGVTWILS